MRIRRGWLFALIFAVFPLALALAAIFLWPRRNIASAIEPEAPPDLEKLRDTFRAGLAALQRSDGPGAIRQFGSFTFGSRAVEQYRLYFLSQALQMSGNSDGMRVTLARLWERSPRLVGWDQIGSRLASIYGAAGDQRKAAVIATTIATRSDVSAVAGNARWQAIDAAFGDGDIAAALHQARQIAIHTPRAPQAAAAIAVIRGLSDTTPNVPIRLNDLERLQRAVALMRDGDPLHALDEMNALEASGVPAELRQPLQLNRGLALNQLRRYDESNKALESLAAGPYRLAIPAIYTASKNYRVLSSSINPIVYKTIVVRQKVGTVKVRPNGKKKAVARPRYANVKKTIQLIDLAKKAKKDEFERLSIERLKDLLSLPLSDEVRIEVLNTLIGIAESRNQDPYEQELITDLSKLDPSQEAGLQHFWDKAWGAFVRGDLNGAESLFTWIRDTYRNPNVRRQAQYWYARTIERSGRKEEAGAIYQNVAAAPYADLYALHAVARGATRHDLLTNPLKEKHPDWSEIAQQSMPAELRLAYELTALFDYRDARLEIQKNLKRSNQPYADALIADLYNSTGDTLLMMRALRRAYPRIATVEQDSVPPYFLRMYYPLKYADSIFKYAQKNGLDPYLMMGLIHQESYFNPLARSRVGATGLMQLMPSTGKELARNLHTLANLENPDTNIKLGTYYFRTLVNMFGGVVNLAVASYNAGQGNVIRWRRAVPQRPMDEFLESIPFPETRNYVKRVTMLAASYRRLTR